MTWRALLFGLVSAALLSGVAYFNDQVVRQTFLIGNHLPVAVYGALFLFLLTVNPLLQRLRGAALSGKEVAVVTALVLVVCAIPGGNFARTFTPTLMTPFQHEKVEPGWAESGLLDQVPREMLADPEADPRALSGFYQGLQFGDQPFGFTDIPWAAWETTLGYWLPRILVVWFALLGLALVLHRQWAHHEHLPYPIARVTAELLPDAKGNPPPFLRDKLFWIGMAAVLTLHLVNFAHTHFPGIPEINRQINLWPLMDKVNQDFRVGSSMHSWLNFELYFTAIGIAFFLSRDVSFSIGISPLFFGIVGGTAAVYGTSLTAGGLYEPRRHLMAGAYIGLFVMILYTGRHYYWQTMQSALGRVGRFPQIDAGSRWGARVFLVGIAVALVLFRMGGLDMPVVIVLLASLVIMFVVMGRIIAETGLFFVQPYWTPTVVLVGLFGAEALGPEMLLLAGLVAAIFAIDPREALLPFVMNALRLVELKKVAPSRIAPWFAGVLVLGMLITIPITLYFQYAGGTRNIDSWARGHPGKSFVQDTLRVQQDLGAQELLESSLGMSEWERVLAMKPEPAFLLTAGAAFALVLVTSWARLRFPGWPIHPVLFAVWGTYATGKFAMCFLIGWFLKTMLNKYGGDGVITRVKPLMIGLVFGELLGALIPIFINTLYYFATGLRPDKFNVLPG